MKVKIYGSNQDAQELLTKVKHCLEELGLSDFVNVESTTDVALKESLNINKEPALIIEEESIEFRDTIFEGMVPPEDELKSMFVSIVGGDSGGGCGKKDDTGSCGTGCGCH